MCRWFLVLIHHDQEVLGGMKCALYLVHFGPLEWSDYPIYKDKIGWYGNRHVLHLAKDDVADTMDESSAQRSNSGERGPGAR